MMNLKRVLLIFAIAFIAIGLAGCNEEVVKHTVVFENTELIDAKVIDGEKLTEPSAPTQDDYEFINWYEDATFTDLFDFDQTITEDTTIYAKFSMIVVDVTHTIEFANSEILDLQVTDGELVEQPSDPTKVDYVFYDWFADAEFTTLFDFDQVVEADTIIYARYGMSLLSVIAIADALEHNTPTVDKYHVHGTIKSISNIEFGNMVITDGVTDFVIYGVFGADGVLKYDELTEKPVVGDTVYLYGVLSKYNESLEMKNSWLLHMKKAELPEFDLTNYTEMTIASSREAAIDSLVVVEGIVSRITYANGMSPNGLFLVDETGAIYIYDSNIAASVTAGDTIEVAGTRTNYISESEQTQAEVLGYQGAVQLANATLVSTSAGTDDFSTDGIIETTIKELLDTDPTEENITGNIYKVNAFINEVPGTGFTNFYINDLDGTTGSYSYSMNGGNDFEWLREFDGQLKTMYVAVINAKSTTNGLIYRFVPIAIEGDYVYEQSYNPTLAVKYYGVNQFVNEYMFTPSLELVTSLSSVPLGFSDVSLTYSSSNTDSVYFEEVGGELVFETGVPGTAIVTITGIDGTNTYSETVEITVIDGAILENLITVADAIATVDETIVVVEGIVAASLVNKSGFYLIDETGVIAVEMLSSELAQLSLGQLVVITGVKTHDGVETDEVTGDITSVGQIAIRQATVVVNKYGNHEYSTASFKTGKTLADFIGLDKTEDHSTDVYTITATINLVETAWYSLYTLVDGEDSINIYSSNAAQLSFLDDYAGLEVTVEFTVVNWNGKNYVGSIISITSEGVKIVNDSNF